MRHLIAVLVLAALISCTTENVAKKVHTKKNKILMLRKTERSEAAGTLSVVYDVPYVKDGHDLNKLDVYYYSSVRPTVIQIHGGGWIEKSITRKSRMDDILTFLENGWNVVAIDYRLVGDPLDKMVRADDLVADCRQALHWVYTHAQEYNVDTNKIITAGESAGGHLALMTAFVNDTSLFSLPGNEFNYKHEKVAAVFNMFGPTDIPRAFADAYRGVTDSEKLERLDYWKFSSLGSEENHESLGRKVSPVDYITKETTPVYTLHGTIDQLVDSSQATLLHRKLNEYGVQNKLVLMEGVGHNIDSYDRFKGMFEFVESLGIR